MSVTQAIASPKIQALFLMGIRATSLGAKFLLTLFIARYMSFEDLGLYGIIIATSFLLPAFISLGIAPYKTRDAVTMDHKAIVHMAREIGRYYKYVYIILAALSVYVGIYIENIVFTLLALAVILFEHLNSDLYTLMLNRQRPLAANILHFIRSAIWVFVFIILALVFPELQTVKMISLFWAIGGALAFFGFLYTTRHWPWSSKGERTSLIQWVKTESKPAKKMFRIAVLDATVYNLNQYVVTFFLGLELAGVYVYFNQIINAMGNLIRTGILFNARPKIVKAIKDTEKTFLPLYKGCMKNGVLMSILMSVISIPALYVLTKYGVDKPLALEWMPVYGILLLVLIVSMVIEVNRIVLYGFHDDHAILMLSIVNTIVFVVASIILLPLFSLWGAGLSLLVSFTVMFWTQKKYLKKYI